MSRRDRLFLRDIVPACRRLRDCGPRVDWEDADLTPMAIDAVLHNLLIPGEATKNLPAEVRAAAPEIDWRKIAGLRDVLAHGYFALDLSIIRDVIEHKLDAVEAAAERLLGEI